MKHLLSISALLVLWFASHTAQCQLNPCQGDKVGIKSGTGTVTLDRRECDMILLSYDKYFALEVAAKQNDSLKAKTLRYLDVVEQNIALRDSIDDLRDNHIADQDTAIQRYQKLVADYQKTAEDALKNAEYAERRLALAKIKTSLFSVAGGVAGLFVGLLVGKNL